MSIERVPSVEALGQVGGRPANPAERGETSDGGLQAVRALVQSVLDAGSVDAVASAHAGMLLAALDSEPATEILAKKVKVLKLISQTGPLSSDTRTELEAALAALG